MAVNVPNRHFFENGYMEQWIAFERRSNQETTPEEPVVNNRVRFEDEPVFMEETAPFQPIYTRELSETYKQIDEQRSRAEHAR